jgi:hypothetical protein
MKTIDAIVVAALLMFAVGITGIARSTETTQGTWIGEISASHCGMNHPDGASARECTLDCVSQGARFVLVSDGSVYTFADQANEALRVHAGDRVKVAGELKGGVLTALSIERAATEGSR